MGKCIARGDIPYAEINVCDGCIHKDVCGDKDYLTENRCSGKVQGDIEHIAELMKAEEQGLLVRLNERTALAIAAGARAIENNKRLFGVTYMWDIFSKFGNPKELLYAKAAQILREISEPVLTREEAEKALEEAQSSDKG